MGSRIPVCLPLCLPVHRARCSLSRTSIEPMAKVGSRQVRWPQACSDTSSGKWPVPWGTQRPSKRESDLDWGSDRSLARCSFQHSCTSQTPSWQFTLSNKGDPLCQVTWPPHPLPRPAGSRSRFLPLYLTMGPGALTLFLSVSPSGTDILTPSPSPSVSLLQPAIALTSLGVPELRAALWRPAGFEVLLLLEKTDQKRKTKCRQRGLAVMGP